MPSFEESVAGKLSTPDVARTIDDWHSLQAHDVAEGLETDVDKGLVLHEIRARHQRWT